MRHLYNTVSIVQPRDPYDLIITGLREAANYASVPTVKMEVKPIKNNKKKLYKRVDSQIMTIYFLANTNI